MVEFLVQNWQETYDQTYKLFEKIHDDGFHPEVIVGIARGGWIPGRLLSDFFGLRFTANVKVEAYHLIGEMDEEAKITQPINANIEGKSILVVDDIADSGSSMNVVLEDLKSRGVGEIKTATLFYKPRSIVKPDYFIEETTKWVIFGWEFFETIKELGEMWSADGDDH
ncbi:MAG: phosphoribosyltransferase, partial [Candidatus Kariarchaeaceae archaeon]